MKEFIPKIKKIKVAKEVIPKITKKKSSKVNIKKYIVDIKNLIDEIEKFSELNKYKYKDQDLNIIL